MVHLAGEIICAPRNWRHQVVNTLAVSENFWFAKASGKCKKAEYLLSLFLFQPIQPEFFQAVLQALSADPELACGFGHVIAVFS